MVDARGTRLTQRSDESRIYDFDFTTLGDATVELQPAPLTVTQVNQGKVAASADLNIGVPVASGALLQVRLSGGTDGELYQLKAHALDLDDNELTMFAWLEVEDVPDTVGLTVEDGTGKADADAYVSLAQADTYFAARNNNTWLAADQAQKEAAIREATIFLDGRYTFLGEIQSDIQALLWPRYNVTDLDGRDVDPGEVPLRIRNACCEAALLALSAALLPASERGGRISRAKIGPIDVTYADDAQASRNFDWIDTILSGLYTSRGPRRGGQLLRT